MAQQGEQDDDAGKVRRAEVLIEQPRLNGAAALSRDRPSRDVHSGHLAYERGMDLEDRHAHPTRSRRLVRGVILGEEDCRPDGGIAAVLVIHCPCPFN